MPKKITEGKLEQRKQSYIFQLWILKSELAIQDSALLVRQMKNVDLPRSLLKSLQK